MEVILLERVDKLGQMGEVVTVKPGFARNYLLPQKKAMRATKDNVSLFESRRDQLEADNLKRRGEAMGVSTAIEGLSVILTRQASDSYQLYGSVTTRDIAAAAIEAGFTVTRDQIKLDRPIKSVGLHPVRVRLHPEVVVTITVNVARTQDEAEAQARGETIGRDDDDNWGAAQAVFGDRAEAAGDETAGDEAAGDESTGENRDDG
jgi:large subunit ribosomal protein L9